MDREDDILRTRGSGTNALTDFSITDVGHSAFIFFFGGATASALTSGQGASAARDRSGLNADASVKSASFMSKRDLRGVTETSKLRSARGAGLVLWSVRPTRGGGAADYPRG